MRPQPERDYHYLSRLAETAVAVGTAIAVGHELVTEHTAATLALSAAAAAERQASASNVQHSPLEAPITVNPVAVGGWRCGCTSARLVPHVWQPM